MFHCSFLKQTWRLTILGTECLLANEPAECLANVAAARRLFASQLHPERSERLDLLEAIAYKSRGEDAVARRMLKSMQHSPWFADAATEHLKILTLG